MKKSLVIVEDDQLLAKAIYAKLSTEYEVTMVSDGGTAEQTIAKEKPDMVLLDIMLPDKSGIEILTDLKKNAKTKSIPVIMLTNLSEDIYIDKAKELGAKDYIVKSDSALAEIHQKIVHVLGD